MPENLTLSQALYTEHEDQQVSRLLTAVSIVALVCLFSIGAKAWYSGNQTHGIVLWLFNLPIIANMIWFARTKNRNTQKAGLIILVVLLLFYLIASGGESSTGPLWFYALPPLLFYLTSLKTGTAILLFCYLAAVIVFQFPDLSWVSAQYSVDFKIRFFVTLTLESIFCFVLETTRQSARNKLVSFARAHEHAARTDELTGLANRREMLNRLNAEFLRYQRAGHHFSIALIDLDLFKQVNDTFGHDAGDLVLQRFAEITLGVTRQTDLAARWGGEEFMLLLPDTTLLQALALAERLRSEIANTSFTHNGVSIPVTLSAGVCSISNASSVNELLKQADVQLYTAKGSGRNQISPRVRSQNTTLAPST